MGNWGPHSLRLAQGGRVVAEVGWGAVGGFTGFASAALGHGSSRGLSGWLGCLNCDLFEYGISLIFCRAAGDLD